MTLHRRVVLAGSFLLLNAASACAIYMRVPPPPPNAVFVVREPPRVREEIIVVRPGPQHVWIPGYYIYRGNDYVLVPGRWELPPAGMREWVAPRWHHEPRGWYFIEGHWR